jgi:chromosome segregation ATPase
MELSEIRTLKKEMEKVIPKDILDASKLVSEHLNTSIEDYKRVQSVITSIVEKVVVAKKTLEKELEELAIKKSEIIAENILVFNQRADDNKKLQLEKAQLENHIGALKLESESINEKINATQKNLDGLVLQKNELTEEIGEFQAYLNKMKVQEQEVKTMTASLIEKKNKASSDYSDVLTRITEADKTLQMKNNEIIIAQDRINNLNK